MEAIDISHFSHLSLYHLYANGLVQAFGVFVPFVIMNISN